MSERILQRIAGEFPLQSLTLEERQDGILPVTRDPRPRRCHAWVRFGPHAMKVEGRIVAWNDVACGISFEIAAVEYRCWVWSNAVIEIRDA